MVTRIYRNKIEVSFEDRKECTIFDGMVSKIYNKIENLM